jgi:hypothetical protein
MSSRRRHRDDPTDILDNNNDNDIIPLKISRINNDHKSHDHNLTVNKES